MQLNCKARQCSQNMPLTLEPDKLLMVPVSRVTLTSENTVGSNFCRLKVTSEEDGLELAFQDGLKVEPRGVAHFDLWEGL